MKINYDFAVSIEHLKYFTADEVLKCGSKDYLIQDIPQSMRGNIIPTLKVLDRLRNYIGIPIILNCAYRDATHNAAVHGEANSLHLQFNALDFTIGPKSYLSTIYNLLSYWDNCRYFDFLPKCGSMGLGLYENRFIHIDTRAVLNFRAPARWNG